LGAKTLSVTSYFSRLEKSMIGVKPQHSTFQSHGGRSFFRFSSISCGENCLGNDPETASLSIQVFHAVPEPSFSAAQNLLPGLDFTANLHVHKGFIRSCSLEGRQRAKRALEGNPNQGFPSKSVRRASSEPAALEGGLGKAKPSMVASAVSGSSPFSTHTKWKRTFFIKKSISPLLKNVEC